MGRSNRWRRSQPDLRLARHSSAMRPTVNGLHRTGAMTRLAEPLISRRTLLLGTLGLWFGVLVAACTCRNPSALSSPSASASAYSSSLAMPACVIHPATTDGYHYVDE